MNTPLVSIILPTYNGNPEWIQMAINSVLRQTFHNFEIIIIDDASTNNIASTIYKFCENDTRIIFIKNLKNLERSTSKNNGIQASRGKYIAFIDDDDIWLDSEKLEKQVNFMENNREFGLCGTDVLYIDEFGKPLYEVITKNSDEELRGTLLGSNQFAHSSVMLRKDVLQKSGMFNEMISLAEDYDLWMRIGMCAKMCNLKFFGIQYRKRKGNTSSKNKIKIEIIAFYRSMHYLVFYPNRTRGIISHLISVFFPDRLIVKLLRLRNLLSRVSHH